MSIHVIQNADQPISNIFSTASSAATSILNDFETIVAYIDEHTLHPTPADQLLPMDHLNKLNYMLANPIKLKIKRPQLRSFPNLSGLYLLGRATGMVEISHIRSGLTLTINQIRYREWQRLNFQEKYYFLLETWLLDSPISILGGGIKGAWADNRIIMILNLFPHLAKQSKRAEVLLTCGNNIDLALMQMLGLVSFEVETNKSKWKVRFGKVSHFGLALLNALRKIEDDYFLYWEKDKVSQKAKLFKALKPCFPHVKELPPEAGANFQSGIFRFKIVLCDTHRIISFAAELHLDVVCDIILEAFDFDNDHLHEFRYKDRRGIRQHIAHYAIEESPDSSEIRLGDLGLQQESETTLIYDFGDNWEFKMKLLGQKENQPDFRSEVHEKFGQVLQYRVEN